MEKAKVLNAPKYISYVEIFKWATRAVLSLGMGTEELQEQLIFFLYILLYVIYLFIYIKTVSYFFHKVLQVFFMNNKDKF